MTTSKVTLPGSERESKSAAGAHADADELLTATIVLRRAAPLTEGATAFETEHGAAASDIVAVVTSVTEAGLKVVSVHAPSRRIRVEGTVAAVSDYFATTIHQVSASGAAQQRARSGALSVPAELDGVVVAVLGIDDRRQAFTRHAVVNAAASSVSYTPLQLADIYGFPAGDGSGQTIAIVELGGGFGQNDLDTYFSGLGLPSPTVRAVSVDGAKNEPGKDPNADGEVLLDIEVAGAIAPAAEIVVYFAPNTDAGFLDAVATAAHATPTPCAISISWGQSEDQWTAQARNALDGAMADAVTLGATVTAAAGDNGSGDNEPSGEHCDFPASSPHALGCGGTSLQASGSTVTSETVWNNGSHGGATGGGVSSAFPVPTWQAKAGVPKRSDGTPGRGVPDIAANADPQTGYQVLVDGKQQIIGGTSAVAPLWAGLLARLAQENGKTLGLVQPLLYAKASAGKTTPLLRDITDGDNGAYRAGPGWDACTGLGVPVAAITALAPKA